MPDHATALRSETASVRILLPPRHRLFVVFDGAEQARVAIDALRADGLEGDDIWVYEGDEGVDDLDPSGTEHGPWGRLVRLVESAMTNDDVAYLRILAGELRRGHLVLAVRVASEHEADAMATELRARGGHSFAYGAHWDFVPVVFGTKSAPAA